MNSPSSSPAPGGSDVVHRIESAASALVGVNDRPPVEAVVRFEALHRELQGALADLDQA